MVSPCVQDSGTIRVRGSVDKLGRPAGSLDRFSKTLRMVGVEGLIAFLDHFALWLSSALGEVLFDVFLQVFLSS